MNKKLLVGTLLLTGFFFLSASSAFAQDEAKPWESMLRFRGEDKLTAKEMEMPKEDFYAYREEMRVNHREERITQREERLKSALKNGCLTEEEMATKMQTRKGRFSR